MADNKKNTNNTANVKSIPAADARANFSEILAEAYYQGKYFLVKKSRKPMAVIVGIEHFKALQQAARQNIEEKEVQQKQQTNSHTTQKQKVASMVDKVLSVSY